jgi:hypothetical protein
VAAKYVALRDFDDYKKGDPVPASRIGDQADQLLTDGMIAEAQTQASTPDSNQDALTPSNPHVANAVSDPQIAAPEPVNDAPRLDQVEPGGMYIVNDKKVNANGELLK